MDDKRRIFKLSVQKLSETLQIESSADIKRAMIDICGKSCAYFYVDGFLDKSALERILSATRSLDPEIWDQAQTLEEFAQSFLSFADCAVSDFESAIDQVLRGFLLLVFEAFPDRYLIAESRHVPQRSLKEPDKGKTLRGPHEGFGESLNVNLALLRRRIVNKDLCCVPFCAGKKTKTRLCLCYLNTVADPNLVKRITAKLQALSQKEVCSGEESVTEALFYASRAGCFNPLPRVRYSERPDTCAAELLEGKLLILVDTTPNAVILPITLFDFMEESDDYYFPPFTATYLRVIRFISFLSSVFLVPLWLLAVKFDAQLPNAFSFLLIADPYAVPVFLQLLLIEMAVDALKLASLNTPEPLANSLSVVGGLLLGDFAVKSGWFVPQTILYSALAAITGYIPNNYEFGYCLKFARILLICAVELMGPYGMLFGTLILISTFALARRNPEMRGFLAPFYPFSARGILKLFIRTKSGREEKNKG